MAVSMVPAVTLPAWAAGNSEIEPIAVDETVGLLAGDNGIAAISDDVASDEGEASVAKNAFGIATPEMTESERALNMAQAPYGPVNNTGNSPVTIFEKSELFLSYGFDGHKNTNSSYVRTYDFNNTHDCVETISDFKNFNSDLLGSATESYRAIFVDVDSFNPGLGYYNRNSNGGDYLVAQTIIDNNWKQHLQVLDQSGNVLADQIINDAQIKWMDLDAYEGEGYMSVAAGNFDGDPRGIDEIAVYMLCDSVIHIYHMNGSGFTECCNMINVASRSAPSNSARDRAMVSMVAEDLDRDGRDELVVTSCNSDAKDSSLKDLETKLRVYNYDGAAIAAGTNKITLSEVYSQNYTARQWGSLQGNFRMAWGTSPR